MHSHQNNCPLAKDSGDTIMKTSTLPFLRYTAEIFLAALLPISTVLATPAQVPLETHIAGAGVEPNIMLLLDSSLSMDKHDGYTDRRIVRAKNAFTSILEDTEGVRFCLATFDQRRAAPHRNRKFSNGAYMNSNRVCGTDKDTLIAEIDNIYEGAKGAWPNCDGKECYAHGTPTNSALYDIVQYFKTPNAGPFFGQFDGHANYPDPLLNNCQENVVIIATDGYEHSDWTLASDDGNSFLALPTDSVTVDGQTRSLPRWADGVDGNLDQIPRGNKTNRTICRANPMDPAHPYNDDDEEKYAITSCLDDLALYAHQQDLRTGTSNGINWDHADFPMQNLTIHTIGLNMNAEILQSAADLGGGLYRPTTDATSIELALGDIISSVAKVSGTQSDITASGSSFFLAPNGIDFFITSYNTDGWFGELYSYNVTESAPGVINSTAGLNWRASENIPVPASRTLFTRNTTANTTVSLDASNLSEQQLIQLGVDPILFDRSLDVANEDGELKYPTDEDFAAAIAAANLSMGRLIDYFKGDSTNENSQSGGTQEFRDRTRTIGLTTTRNVLGDIIHSRPVYINKSDYGYPDDPNADPDKVYSKFLEGLNRDAMVYIGANDGILHGINAETGVEKFGFIPATLVPKLREQSELNFDENHQIYIDGKPTGTDAKIGGSWATVYASPLGAGGKGLFLLDVTNPEATIGDLFKWEINSADTGFSDMGFIINQSKITRVLDDGGDEHWVLITGNGVHSENGAAVIYVIDLDDGTLFQNPIVLDSGFESNGDPKYSSLSEGNGVTDVAAVGNSGSTFTSQLYASTLKGEIWRLQYNKTTGNNGAFEFHFRSANDNSVKPFFTATSPDTFDYDRDGNTSETVVQPITGELTVTQGPSDDTLGALGGQLISFGTGRYYELGDIEQTNNLTVQSFYTLWDTGKKNASGKFVDGDLDRTDLQAQTITSQYGLLDNDSTFRDTSNNAIDWTTKRGWFVDLKWDFGERVISRPISLFGHIAFKTIVPTHYIQDVHDKSPINDTWLSTNNNGINQANQCNTDASGVHGWYMQFDRISGTPPLAAVFSAQGPQGIGISAESVTGSNIFQNPVIIQTSDGTSSYINIDTEGNVTEVESGAQFQRSSWRRLQ